MSERLTRRQLLTGAAGVLGAAALGKGIYDVARVVDGASAKESQEEWEQAHLLSLTPSKPSTTDWRVSLPTLRAGQRFVTMHGDDMHYHLEATGRLHLPNAVSTEVYVSRYTTTEKEEWPMLTVENTTPDTKLMSPHLGAIVQLSHPRLGQAFASVSHSPDSDGFEVYLMERIFGY